ncbi:hypothetical protein [Nocardioides alcanivorans]|uniref:hypothetical protein n=1 Tax=Nocardioides alcanivorans TaxID=2897352 RepID=UPI001F232983|nr:hypothetical protein [Nocardioides alcanivorans]
MNDNGVTQFDLAVDHLATAQVYADHIASLHEQRANGEGDAAQLGRMIGEANSQLGFALKAAGIRATLAVAEATANAARGSMTLTKAQLSDLTFGRSMDTKIGSVLRAEFPDLVTQGEDSVSEVGDVADRVPEPIGEGLPVVGDGECGHVGCEQACCLDGGSVDGHESSSTDGCGDCTVEETPDESPAPEAGDPSDGDEL